MEKEMTKLSLIAKLAGTFIFVLVFSINMSVFFATDDQNGHGGINGLLTQASADCGESSSTKYWSAQTSCPGGAGGTYAVCNENGTGNWCSPAGDVTCTCGLNCD